MSSSDFELVESSFHRGGVPAALQTLADELLRQQKYHELYRARKMQVRQRLGLALLDDDPEEVLSESQRMRLEEELTAVCREIGSLLMGSGKAYDGWMFLRAAGAKDLAKSLLDKIETTEDNREELIEVAMREGVDVARGFTLVIENYGCCNAITTFDSEVARHGRSDRQAAAAIITRVLHRDLLANVRRDIERQEGTASQGDTLAALIADRPWLFGEMSYHIDTTHLASVVRFARLTQDPAVLRLAVDLTEYGRRLHSQFQYPGDEPFGETYLASGKFFRSLLGEQVDDALAYFKSKAETLDIPHHGTAPAEVYVDLLARLGRPGEALAVALKMLADQPQQLGIAPSLLELSRAAGDYQAVQTFCRERGDLLGFTTAMAAASVPVNEQSDQPIAK